MKNINLRIVTSAVCLASIMAAFTKMEAGPVRFDQVVQIMNAKPGKAETGSFTRLKVVNYYDGIIVGDDDDNKKKPTTTQDGRVITETTSEIVEETDCNCDQAPERGKFPKWALLGLAAIPIAFILIKRKKDNGPGQTLTPTPGTPTPDSPTPKTPTPTPNEPVPEPMTILLFGTGLASIGLAARKRFGRKGESEGEKDEELD